MPISRDRLGRFASGGHASASGANKRGSKSRKAFADTLKLANKEFRRELVSAHKQFGVVFDTNNRGGGFGGLNPRIVYKHIPTTTAQRSANELKRNKGKLSLARLSDAVNGVGNMKRIPTVYKNSISHSAGVSDIRLR